MSERLGRARLAAGLALLAAMSSPRALPSPAGRLPVPARAGECLVLIDVEAFYCGLCLEALLAFCRAVPAANQETRIRGVLLNQPASGGRTDAELARIGRKKWEGFRRANGIRFPVLADERGIFRRPEKAGASVVLFDVPGGAIRTFDLPLKPNELAEVLRFLGQ